MKSVRIERINAELQKAISNIISNDIRDPQIDAIISVSSVETTPDLSYARVFITSIGTTSTKEVLNTSYPESSPSSVPDSEQTE